MRTPMLSSPFLSDWLYSWAEILIFNLFCHAGVARQRHARGIQVVLCHLRFNWNDDDSVYMRVYQQSHGFDTTNQNILSQTNGGYLLLAFHVCVCVCATFCAHYYYYCYYYFWNPCLLEQILGFPCSIWIKSTSQAGHQKVFTCKYYRWGAACEVRQPSCWRSWLLKIKHEDCCHLWTCWRRVCVLEWKKRLERAWKITQWYIYQLVF